jgi:LacI family transcriptional regulator
VTIHDVAKAAGVSTATAARALGGYGHVSQRSRDRVQAAAQELGYRPNELARSMVTGRTTSLGLIVADIENPFFAAITRAVGDAARQRGYEVLLANTDEDLASEERATQLFLDKRVDGLIVAPASSRNIDHLRAARDAGGHLVTIDRRVRGMAVDSVTIHNRLAAALAVNRLVEEGHTRIGYLTGTVDDAEAPSRRITTGDERILGYREALQEAGLDAETYVRAGNLTRSDAVRTTLDLLDMAEPPTAMLAPDSVLTLGVLQAARQRNLSIPHELSVVGFDDTDWAEVVTPPLSVISQPVYEMGQRAVAMLLDRIDGAAGRERHVRLRARLIERESIGPVPAG